MKTNIKYIKLLFSKRLSYENIRLGFLIVVFLPFMTLFQNCSSNYEAIVLESTNSFTNNSLALNSEGKQNFQCKTGDVAKSNILRLTNREYKNAVFTLIDDFSTTSKLSSNADLIRIGNMISSDVLAADRFAAKEQNDFLNPNLIKSNLDFAVKAADLVVSSADGLSKYSNTNGCLAQATLTKDCLTLFTKEFGSKVFRRKLSVQEINFKVNQNYTVAIPKNDILKILIASFFLDPDFIYRVYDRGIATANAPSNFRLTSEELASKLSFFITGKAPDAQLAKLAQSNSVLTDEMLSVEIDRLLKTTDAKDNLVRFFRESYGYDRFDGFTHSTNFLNGISPVNLTNAMTNELDHFFYDTVINQSGKFSDLMTSQKSRLTDPSLSQIYGLGATTGDIVLPQNRAGFLNRAAFLAKKSGNYTSPVKRGLLVYENVLCKSMGEPPQDAPTSVSEDQIVSELRTTRQRYTGLTEQAGTSCVSCHSIMNKYGYLYENYDSLGRYRVKENIYKTDDGLPVASLPIESHGELKGFVNSEITFQKDSIDFTHDLATNENAMLCFSSHLKKFEARRRVKPDDGCQVNKVVNTLYGASNNQGSIKESIKNFILSDDFKTWSY